MKHQLFFTSFKKSYLLISNNPGCVIDIQVYIQIGITETVDSTTTGVKHRMQCAEQIAVFDF